MRDARDRAVEQPLLDRGQQHVLLRATEAVDLVKEEDRSQTALIIRQLAVGSGVIVSADGYIMTNAHVVENAADIEVRLSDDRKFAATLVGSDPKTDLAVVKIDPGTVALPPAARPLRKVAATPAAAATPNPPSGTIGRKRS